jgi:hypothetical protein
VPLDVLTETILPLALRTTSAPGPLGVVAPYALSKATISLAFVQVTSCCGRDRGESPGSPQLRIRPGTRFNPDSARESPCAPVTEPCHHSRTIAAFAVSSWTSRAGRPFVVSLSSRPWYTPTPAGSPGAPAVGSSTKKPALIAAVAPAACASEDVVSRFTKSGP